MVQRRRSPPAVRARSASASQRRHRCRPSSPRSRGWGSRPCWRQVVAADDDRRSAVRLDHRVEGEAGAMALPRPISRSASAGLEGDPLAGHVEPAVQMGVAEELFISRRSSGCRRDHRQRDPAEGPLPRQKSGRMYAGTKPERERVGDALVERDLADVVAVVDDRNAERKSSISTCVAQFFAAASRSRACCAPRPAPPSTGRRSAGRQVAVDRSCAEVWSVTRSGRMPPACARFSSAGSSSAALPSRPTETARPASCDARCERARRRGRSPARRDTSSAGESRCSTAGTRRSATTRRRSSRRAAERRPCRRAGGQDPPAAEIAAVVLPPRLDDVSYVP